MSGSVRIGVRSVPTWGCLGQNTNMPVSLTLVTLTVRSSFDQVIPSIVIVPGHAVFAAGADPHRYLVNVVNRVFSRNSKDGRVAPRFSVTAALARSVGTS